MEVAFEASWFVLLAMDEGHPASLAFMHPNHPSAPPGSDPFTGKGMCLEFQVADVMAEYDRFVRDTVNFLDYVSEPTQVQRRALGVWVVLFLLLFTWLAWLLKKEYWKDVH